MRDHCGHGGIIVGHDQSKMSSRKTKYASKTPVTVSWCTTILKKVVEDVESKKNEKKMK